MTSQSSPEAFEQTRSLSRRLREGSNIGLGLRHDVLPWPSRHAWDWGGLEEGSGCPWWAGLRASRCGIERGEHLVDD